MPTMLWSCILYNPLGTLTNEWQTNQSEVSALNKPTINEKSNHFIKIFQQSQVLNSTSLVTEFVSKSNGNGKSLKPSKLTNFIYL